MTQHHEKKQWLITLNGEEVENLLDTHGNKTLDPLSAASAAIDGGFIPIGNGDTIAFERIT